MNERIRSARSSSYDAEDVGANVGCGLIIVLMISSVVIVAGGTMSESSRNQRTERNHDLQRELERSFQANERYEANWQRKLDEMEREFEQRQRQRKHKGMTAEEVLKSLRDEEAESSSDTDSSRVRATDEGTGQRDETAKQLNPPHTPHFRRSQRHTQPARSAPRGPCKKSCVC